MRYKYVLYLLFLVHYFMYKYPKSIGVLFWMVN